MYKVKVLLVMFISFILYSCANIVIDTNDVKDMNSDLDIALSTYDVGASISNLNVLDYQTQEKDSYTIVAYTTGNSLEELRIAEIPKLSTNDIDIFDVSIDLGLTLSFDLTCNNSNCTVTYVKTMEGVPNPFTGLGPQWQCSIIRLGPGNWTEPVCNGVPGTNNLKVLLYNEDVYTLLSNYSSTEVFVNLNSEDMAKEFYSDSTILYSLIETNIEEFPIGIFVAKDDMVFQDVPNNSEGGGEGVFLLSLSNPYDIFVYSLEKQDELGEEGELLSRTITANQLYHLSNLIDKPEHISAISINDEIHIATTNDTEANIIVLSKNNGEYSYNLKTYDLRTLSVYNLHIVYIKYLELNGEPIINMKIRDIETSKEYVLLLSESQIRSDYIVSLIRDKSVVFADLSGNTEDSIFISNDGTYIRIMSNTGSRQDILELNNKELDSLAVNKTGENEYTLAMSIREKDTGLKYLTVIKFLIRN